jgi:hypothetical protein
MKRNILLAVLTAALAIAPAAFAETSNLTVTVGAEASFAAVDAATSLTHSGTNFASFTGITNFTYKIRTTTTGGTGSITVALANFETNGPALSDLSFTCTDAVALGTACSSTTATTSAQSVIIFGADKHSADAGNAGTTPWTLVDKPTTKTGNYSSLATYTISAT